MIRTLMSWCGATTISITAFSLTALSIMTLSIMTLSITTLSITTLSKMSLSITVLDIEYCIAQCRHTENRLMLYVAKKPDVLTVIMMNVMAPMMSHTSSGDRGRWEA